MLAGGPDEAVKEGEGGFFEEPEAVLSLVGDGWRRGDAGSFTLLDGGFG